MIGGDRLEWGPLDWQSRGQGFKSPQRLYQNLADFRLSFSLEIEL